MITLWLEYLGDIGLELLEEEEQRNRDSVDSTCEVRYQIAKHFRVFFDDPQQRALLPKIERGGYRCDNIGFRLRM